MGRGVVRCEAIVTSKDGQHPEYAVFKDVNGWAYIRSRTLTKVYKRM